MKTRVMVWLGLLCACWCCDDDIVDSPDGSVNNDEGSFVEEEVSFAGANAMLTLEGTLLLPQAPFNAPFPGVVLIHGSGPQSRNEPLAGQLGMGFGKTIFVFREIAEALAGQGFAVLRYDKRTCNQSTGCFNSYPLYDSVRFGDFIGDGLAALDYLAERPEVDGEKLAVIGHSQGGQIVPYLAQDRSGVKHTVLLAAPYRPIDALWAYQADWMRQVMEILGSSPQEIEEQIGWMDQVSQELAELRQGTFEGMYIYNTPASFWLDWMNAGDETPAIVRTLESDVSVLQGGYDWNVPPSEAELFRQDLSGQPTATITVLEGLTHPLVRISEPDWTQIEAEDIGDGVDRAAIDALVDSLKGTFAPRR